MSNINNTLEYISLQAQNPIEFIAACEERYNKKIEKIAQQIYDREVSEIVMIAGPSSAGKTTTAKKLRECLKGMGIDSYTVSLDDFYLDNKDAPRFPDGTPDFETVDCLDIKCFHKTMKQLLETGEADLPEFDFLTGARKPEYRRISIKPTDVIIVEGLHALNPVITGDLPQERLMKIYINLSSRIYDEKGNILLNKRNMRFIRRMVRDYKFRGNSVERSYEMWITVRYGEDTYLFPFQNNADIKLNTIHLYESCVLKDTAIKLLGELPKTSEFYKESQRLIRSLENFPSMNSEDVPEDSLLREFIGAKEK
jgi:uridine kinase